MSVKDNTTLAEMVRELPIRTALYTLGPICIALAQFVNGYVNDISLVVLFAFALVMIAASVFITRYHLTEYRVSKLERELA